MTCFIADELCIRVVGAPVRLNEFTSDAVRRFDSPFAERVHPIPSTHPSPRPPGQPKPLHRQLHPAEPRPDSQREQHHAHASASGAAEPCSLHTRACSHAAPNAQHDLHVLRLAAHPLQPAAGKSDVLPRFTFRVQGVVMLLRQSVWHEK